MDLMYCVSFACRTVLDRLGINLASPGHNDTVKERQVCSIATGRQA